MSEQTLLVTGAINRLSEWLDVVLSKPQKALYAEQLLGAMSANDIKRAVDTLMDKLPAGSRRMPSIRDIKSAVNEFHEQRRRYVKANEDSAPLTKLEHRPRFELIVNKGRIARDELAENFRSNGSTTLADYMTAPPDELREMARRDRWGRVVRPGTDMTDGELAEHLGDILGCLREWQRCEATRCSPRCDGMLPKLTRGFDGRIVNQTRRCRNYPPHRGEAMT